MEVDGQARIPGAQVVDVSAVWRAVGRRPACRHDRLARNVATDDVVNGVVQLRSDEVPVIDFFDVQGRHDFGQRRGLQAHPGIMPQCDRSPPRRCFGNTHRDTAAGVDRDLRSRNGPGCHGFWLALSAALSGVAGASGAHAQPPPPPGTLCSFTLSPPQAAQVLAPTWSPPRCRPRVARAPFGPV